MVSNKLSIKIFIKRKTRAGKACAYRMLEFQDVCIYIYIYKTPDSCVHCEAHFVRHNSIVCQTLPDVWC